MTAINSGPVGEVGGVRLPLQSLHGYGSVFMYSASTSPGGGGGATAANASQSTSGATTGEVTLRLREPEDIPEEVLARLEDTATLSISLQGDAVLRLGAAAAGVAGNGNLELFDSESGPDLTLSPQTFTSTAEAFINDNSDSLGVPGDNDTGSGEESRVSTGDPAKLGVKKPRPKASSPNRQGPQQCQVCGKVFNNASALTKHKLTHSDERKYVCTMCGKAFKRQDHLNGHMLTHRNKKPYECKAEGCGKSYCDARSLRRHTENHHSAAAAAAAAVAATNNNNKLSEQQSPSSPNTGPNTPNTPGSNPSTPSTPGAAAATTTTAASQNGHGHTALKQLLASEPAPPHLKNSNGAGGNNEGLTKQHLEFIQQIMQQTQQQQVTVQTPSQTQQQSSTTTANGQITKGKPIIKSTTTISPPIVTPINSSVVANSRSSPKPKVWNHSQQQAQQQAQQQSHQQAQQQHQQHQAQQQSQQQQQQQQQQQSQQPQLQTQANSPGSGSGGKIGGSPSPGSSSTSPGLVVSSGKSPVEPKPVECNLCHRKFKNIPALNGHMRLHGGYFKKDSDNKKSEKKEVVGPPLQTASVSVRALIEEKIIQKRTTATDANASQHQLANGTTFSSQTLTTASTTATSTADGQTQQSLQQQGPQIIGKMNFAVPAPPPLAEKIRRLSDGEHFRQPNVTIAGHVTAAQKQMQEASTQAQAQALADMILKGTTKMAVKRATSDPGQRVQLTYQTSPVVNNQQQQQQQQTQQQQQQQQQQQSPMTENFTMTGYPEDGGYFSPSLQDEVFQQVTSVPDNVLLHASQLDAIQFQASGLLQDQAGNETLPDINLEERFSSQHTVNPDLQALVNSPLPDSLAEFSTYGANYSDGTHTLPSQSPLPSPLTRHDSPSFTYPTPPASQEGLLSGSLPLLSPQEDSDAVHSVSSPLSAAFYSTSMSSAAAIEEALSEVLPDEADADTTDLYSSGCPNPHSPLPSPLSATPAPSPLSSLPPSSVSSPGPGSFATAAFPMSPHHTLQSQMMPNSEDPLLSSSPKDFAAGRRKFEFQSYKLITNQNLVDFGLGNGNVAGIVVDNNGEFKLIQTAGLQKANVYVQAGALSSALSFRKEICLAAPKIEQNNLNVNMINGHGQNVNLQNNVYQQTLMQQQAINPARFLIQTNQTAKPHLKHKAPSCLPVSVDQIKEEEIMDEDVFLSPNNVATSGSPRHQRKRPRLDVPIHCNNSVINGKLSYPSRLRRACDRHWDSSYTPPPTLDPSRPGSGLYARLHQSERDSTELSSDDAQDNDGPPPRINIGTRYQATIPQMVEGMSDRLATEPEMDHLLWDPGIDVALTETEMEMYLQFACCAAVPGGGRNKEYAFHLLHMCRGNIREAMLKLMRPTPTLPMDHPLRSYECNDSDRWTSHEMDMFYQCLLKYNKDFSAISQEIGTKCTKQCVQFYYLWKRLCPEEYKWLRLRYGKPKVKSECKDIKDSKELQDAIASVTELDFSEGKSILHRTLMQTTNERENSATLTTSEGELRLFAYECQDSFSGGVTVSMAGSIRALGCAGKAGSAATVDHTNSQTHTSIEQQVPAPTPLHYPCKICGKVFNKVKSRSAHMKSHRPIPSPDSTVLESRKLQQQQQQQQHLQTSIQHIQSSAHQPSNVQIHHQQQGHRLVIHAQNYHQHQHHQQSLITPTNCDVQNGHVWHNPPRLRPP